MRRIVPSVVLVSLLALTGCGSSNPWSERARAYADTLEIAAPAKVAEYLSISCANPNLSPAELSERFGATWDELTGSTFSAYGEAVRVICPDQFD